MKNLVEIYCLSDDLVKYFSKIGKKFSAVGRKATLSRQEYITLALLKQEMGIKTNKQLYEFVAEYMRRDFPTLPSYVQFNQGLKNNFGYLILMTILLTQSNKAHKANCYIVDSSPMPICANAHRSSVTIDLGLASSGKNLNGWYYGFKLHIIINDFMEIVAVKFTDASMHDIEVLDEHMVRGLYGWLVGDKGYISKKKSQELFQRGIKLLTRPRKNMKKYPATHKEARLLACRQRVETVFSQLKHRFMLINHYARSLESFFGQALAAIIAYSLQKSTNLSFDCAAFLGF